METQIENVKRSIFATILSEKNVSNYTRAFIAFCGVLTVYMTFKINTRTDNIEQKTEIIEQKADVAIAKVDTVHKIINSGLTVRIAEAETSGVRKGILQGIEIQKEDDKENK